MEGVTFALDAPAQKTSWVQVARAGNYNDPRYGDFSITPEDFNSWAQSFNKYNNGSVLVDADHSSEKGGKTEASGWAKQLKVDGQDLWAEVDWTGLGEQQISDRRYKYISPAFSRSVKDEQGNDLGPALTSISLTNKPFLKRMAAVSLSENFDVDELADSRRRMDLSKIAQQLNLDESASESQILDAIKGLSKSDDDKVKKLEDQITTLQDAVKSSSDEAQKLREERQQEKFDAAINEARERGALDAKDETYTLYKNLYDKDEESTLKILSQLPQQFNVEAQGHGQRILSGGVQSVDGHPADEERGDLHTRAQQLSQEKGISYQDAIFQLEGAPA